MKKDLEIKEIQFNHSLKEENQYFERIIRYYHFEKYG